jgi:hypothetical protein
VTIFRLAVLILNAVLLVVGVSYAADVGNWKTFFANQPFDAFLVFLFLLLPIVNGILVILQAREIGEFNKDLRRARNKRLLDDMGEPFRSKRRESRESQPPGD